MSLSLRFPIESVILLASLEELTDYKQPCTMVYGCCVYVQMSERSVRYLSRSVITGVISQSTENFLP